LCEKEMENCLYNDGCKYALKFLYSKNIAINETASN